MKNLLLTVSVIFFCLPSNAQNEVRDLTLMYQGDYLFCRVRIMEDFNYAYKGRLEEAFPDGIVERCFAESDMSEEDSGRIDEERFYLLFPRAVPDKINITGNKIRLEFGELAAVEYDYRLMDGFPVPGVWMEVASGDTKDYYQVGGWGVDALMIKTRMRYPINLPLSVGESNFYFIFDYIPAEDPGYYP